MKKDSISNLDFNECANDLIIDKIIPIIKAFAHDKETYMNIIKDFWNLPEKVQTEISSKFLEEFISNKPVSISRFLTIIKEILNYYNENNIDLNELKIDEDRKAKEIIDGSTKAKNIQEPHGWVRGHLPVETKKETIQL